MEQLREAAQVSAAIEEAGKAKAAKNIGKITRAAQTSSYMSTPLIIIIGLSLLWEADQIRQDLGHRIYRNKKQTHERLVHIEKTLGQLLGILEDHDFNH